MATYKGATNYVCEDSGRVTLARLLMARMEVSSVLMRALTGWQGDVCQWGKAGIGKVAVSSMLVISGT